MTVHKFKKDLDYNRAQEIVSIYYDQNFNVVNSTHHLIAAFSKNHGKYTDYFVRISDGRLYNKESLKEFHYTYEKVTYEIFEMYSRYLAKNSELAYKDAQMQYFGQ